MKKISLKIVLRLWLVCVVLSLIFATATSTPGEAATEKKLYMTTGLTIRKVVIIPASVDDVWKSWTTKEGVITFFAPKASVELAVGGDYEMYFDPKKPEGQRGSEWCKILSFVPGEMLSFTWNAPPSMPEVRKERTWVVLFFRTLKGNKTQVNLLHVGW